MNERDLMEDVLLVLKGAADLYLHGTIESSTLNVHTTFEKVLNDTLCMQNEVYAAMAQKGWYPSQAADQQQIEQVKQKFAPNAQFVHIDIDTASISRNIHGDVPIVADAKEAITKMAEYVTECNTKKWLTEIDIWKNEHPLSMKNRPLMGPLDIFNEINKQFDKAIIVTDVGQHQMLTSQFVDITENRKLIMSGGLGTMGYGLPGAIGAQIGNPGVPVISISGDGGMQMNIQELATAVLEELPIINCIFNNTYLGMVRQWQKLFYGKRYSMTNLRSGALSRRTNGEEYPKYTPDFIKLAESYGAKGIRVTKREEIAAAFEEARKSTKVPTVIEFIIDPEEMVYPMVKPGGTLADLIMDC